MGTATSFEHIFPWTEEEYFALGETSDRVELFDGSLVVSPAPTPRHQAISRRLANLLEPAAHQVGLEVFEAVNVRLKRGRVPIPDLVVVHPINLDDLVIDAAAVELICEITSPSNGGTDRVLKMHHYAEADIGWYLVVDPDPLTLQLFRLDGDKYVEHAVASAGTSIRLAEPVRVEIDPANLERRG